MSLSPRSSSTLLVVARVALLAAAAGAVVIAFAGRRTGKDARGSAAIIQYSCAMHPQFTSPAPGECPICRMTLERVRTAAAAADRRAADAAPFRASYDVMWARPRPTPREMRAPAYVDARGGGSVVALFYNDEIAALEPDERGTFSASGSPGSSWTVRLADRSSTPWDEATSAVPLAVVGGGVAPAVGTTGWVKLAPRAHKTLVVPDSALLQSSTGPYVLTLASDRRAAAKRSVAIGRTLYGFTSIVGGLRDGERIAVMDAFFVDAERRLGGADTTTPAAAR